MLVRPAAAAPAWPIRFVPMPPAPTGLDSAPVGLGLARLYGHGLDLVVADAVRGLILLRNNGSGRFVEQMALTAGASATCVSAGTLTNGPVQALAAANMLDTYVTVFVPGVAGRFVREDIMVPSSPQSVAMLSLPGEPADVLVVGLSATHGGELLVLQRKSSGWTRRARAALPWLPMGVVPVRYANGVAPELVISPAATNAVAVTRFDPDGSLSVRQVLSGHHPVAASAGAPSVDGDLLVSVGGTRGSVWLRRPGHTFEPVQPLESPEPLTGVAMADLDGDGRPDVVATSIAHVLVARGLPGGRFEPLRTVADAHRGFSPVVGDFDGDGRIDVAWNNSIWRSVSVLRNVTPPGLPGDVDGDGRVDIRDAVTALRAALKLESLSPAALRALDVWPVQPDGSWGDGRVTLSDCRRILRWAAGLEE